MRFNFICLRNQSRVMRRPRAGLQKMRLNLISLEWELSSWGFFRRDGENGIMECFSDEK